MSNLAKKITGYEFFEKEFSTWEATEQIIDDSKAFWCLKKPGSEYSKVCLYRDGCNMFVYGDYGQFTFDSMTWQGSVYNLEYDNIGYQMEKLNYESKQSLYVLDETACKADIFEWLKERLMNRYEVKEKKITKVISFLNKNTRPSHYAIEDFCSENKCGELSEILMFVDTCLDHIDEYEWIAFLRATDFSQFDEECESSLWKAGRRINQRYFVCMYALQVCGEKLKNMKLVNDKSA